MIIQNNKVVLFGDYEKVEATPEKIMSISSKFMENGIVLLPGNFQQMNVNTGMKTFERIMYTDSKNRITVKIGMDTIEVDQIFIENKKYKIEENNERFKKDVLKIFKSIIEAEHISQGVRIGLILEVFHDPNHLVKDLHRTFSDSLLITDEKDIIEWNTKIVKRKGIQDFDDAEKFNISTEVNKVAGELVSFGKNYEFDTVMTKVDVNSIQEFGDQRIEYNYAKLFLDNGFKIFKEINKELEVKLFGENGDNN